MCHDSSHNESNPWLNDKKYRLADFFDMWWDTYKQSPSEFITEEQYKAVNAMRLCRTQALGIDHYACPDCGEITNIYHSCKNRFCPTCSWKDTLKWADNIKSKMLALPHRHVVMTLPHGINNLIKDNQYSLLSMLMKTAANTFKGWMASKFNISPGIISVLHTFGETKGYHVHIHMIVSWGGINTKTKKLQEIESNFVNYNFLKNKFRKQYLDQIVEMFEDNILINHFNNRIDFMRFISDLKRKKWIIKLEDPMNIPTQVIRYIGRYSKRACLSEYKITKIEGENISFKYKDNKNLDINKKPIEKIAEFNYRDFFPRLLQHVPLKYFRIVRYYAAYSNRAAIPKEYLYDPDCEQENNTENWEEAQIEKTGQNPMICEYCKQRKIYLYTSIKRKHETIISYFKKEILNHNKIPDDQAA